MTAGVWNIKIEAGETWRRTINWDGATLDAWTGRMQLRRTHDAPTASLALTTENGGITLSGEDISLLISDSDTSALNGKYVYDLELIDAANIVYKLVKGEIEIYPEATK